MRRVLAFLVLILALAGPASAQRRPITVIAPSAAAPVLRGPLSADTPVAAGPAADPTGTAAAAAAALAQSQIPLRLLSDTPVGGEAGQCRLTCAQAYYFCLSSDVGDDCAPTWGQCRAACDAPGVRAVAGASGG